MGWFRVLIETWWWVLVGTAIGFTAAWLLQRANVAQARRSRVEAEADAALLRTDAESRLQRAEDRLKLIERRLRDRDGDVEELEHARARDLDALSKLKADAARHLGQIDQRDEALHRYRVDLAAQTTRISQLERALDVFRTESPRIDLRRTDEAGSSPTTGSTTSPEPARGTPSGVAASGGVYATGVVHVPDVRSRFDAAAAAAAFGHKVVEDDLTVIEGVGPKIASLLDMAGLHTWRGLASASVPTLQAVLDEGGPAFRMHDPSTWPAQARLAADGQFRELVALQERLDGGRP